MPESTTTNHRDTKWKDALLKTSLPLEYLIGKILVKNKLMVWGEYCFTRKNEENIDTEFSVDLRASEILTKRNGRYWGDLNFLVECKYSYRNVKWIFAPHPDDLDVDSQVVTTFQELSTKKIPHSAPIFSSTSKLPVCAKGIELHSTDANPQGITRGLYQLRFAAGRLASDLVSEQTTVPSDDDLLIGFVCPVLVTTASLFVLNKRINLKTIENSSRLEQFATRVDALVVAKQPGPAMKSHNDDLIADLHTKLPEIKPRLEQLYTTYRLSPSSRILGWTNAAEQFDRSIRSATNNVLVVTFEAFERTLGTIRKAAATSGSSVVQFANLRKDQYGRGTWVEGFQRDRTKSKAGHQRKGI